jgi:hypothetical protein
MAEVDRFLAGCLENFPAHTEALARLAPARAA